MEMGKRGPAPKPTKLRVLEGNPGRRPLNPDEPEPTLLTDSNVPVPPEILLPAAAEEWRRVAPELCRLGLLSVLDLVPLAAYCQSYAHWLDAERWIAENGTTVVLRDKDGRVKYVQKAPQVGISEKALDKIKVFALQFGMTPSSRSGVSVKPPADGKGRGFFDAA